VAARLILALLLAGCAATQSPIRVVERLYATRIDSRMSGAPTRAELDAIAPYLTPELHDLLAEARTLHDQEAAAAPDEKPAFADGDLFSSLLEGPTAFRIVGDDGGNVGRHRVAVRFTYADAAAAMSWQDTVVVVHHEGGWVIADVEYEGDWDLASKGTLRSHLKGALRRGSACPELASTTWVVTGHRAPGVSAMSTAEADAWDGSVLALGRDRVTFRNGVCATPTFSTRQLTHTEFVSAYRVSADALGLRPGAVCVTNVSCGDDWLMAGTLLVHGDGEILFLWGGVWFRAAPRPR